MGDMAEAGSNRPLIVKRKTVVQGGGHHGGAWKVAYADFVTAMMAFFLLMWLLNATTEEQKKGLADYFAPAVPISRNSGGSDGMFGGDSVSSLESQRADGSYTTLGLAGEADQPSAEEAAEAEAEAAELAALHGLEEELLGRGGESAQMDTLLQHVVTRLTDEGLIVEIFARPGAPIFDGTGAEPLPVLRDVVGMVAELSQMVTNPVAIGAHLPARSVVVADNPVWPVSSDRADSVRMMLESGGLDPARVHRVTGHADRMPVAQDPAAVRNDRVEIVFLRRH
jgi:chemotaxis protein MotB